MKLEGEKKNQIRRGRHSDRDVRDRGPLSVSERGPLSVSERERDSEKQRVGERLAEWFGAKLHFCI